MMRGKRLHILLALAPLALLAGNSAPADGFDRFLVATITGFQEVPALVSRGTGGWRGTFDPTTLEIHWTLIYKGLESDVVAAHVHLGQPGVPGGAVVTLCSAAGPHPCPASPATLNGTITAADVMAAPGQGIAEGELSKLLLAMRAGATYVNVHTTDHPNGELRGQVGILINHPSIKRPVVLP